MSTHIERNKTTVSQDPPKQPGEVYFPLTTLLATFSYKNTLQISCNVTTSPKSLSQRCLLCVRLSNVPLSVLP